MRTVAALLSTFAITACAVDPTRLPVPGAYVPNDKYSITIEFASVLNLPARAKVDSGGVQVGVLDRVQLVGSTAVASVDIAGGVLLPQNTRAELRQATVLGDIYIALLPPTNPAPAMLRDGDTIPLDQTTPPDNVEDALRSMSNLVGGGTIGTLQDTVIGVNKAFPEDPAELDRIQQKLSGVLTDLAANQDMLDGMLASTRNISATLSANTSTFDRLVTEGPEKLDGLANVTLDIIEIIVSFQPLGKHAGELLVPVAPDIMDMLTRIAPMIATVATADTTVPVVMDKLVALIRDKLIPFFGAGGPRFTVSEINSPGIDPAHRADQVIDLMQTMGLMG